MRPLSQLGSAQDMDPPVNPPKQIPDPEDTKPTDWVDEESQRTWNSEAISSWTYCIKL